jgi:hypothetical protein
MSKKNKGEVLIPDLVNREKLMLLCAIQSHGGKLSVEDAATYLRKSESEIVETAK